MRQVLGVAATFLAGAAVCDLWGKKAYQSAQITDKWGSVVGKQADQSLTKFKGFSDV